MEIFFKSLLIGIFAVVPSALWAQGQGSVLLGEFGKINSEEIEARLGGAMAELRDAPGSQLQFVFSRGENDSLGSAYRLYGRMRTYFTLKKFGGDRVSAIFCEPLPSQKGQIWLVPAGEELKKCDAERIVITKTTLFDTAPSPTDRGTDPSCCVVDAFGGAAATDSIKAFAKLLKQYPDSKAYVYLYGGTNVWWTSDAKGRKREVRDLDTAKDIAALSRKTRRTLTEAGIDTKRIITRNAGYRDSTAEIELWIVPKEGIIPKTSPDYPKKRRSKIGKLAAWLSARQVEKAPKKKDPTP